jgi:hypothetical protein
MNGDAVGGSVDIALPSTAFVNTFVVSLSYFKKALDIKSFHFL